MYSTARRIPFFDQISISRIIHAIPATSTAVASFLIFSMFRRPKPLRAAWRHQFPFSSPGHLSTFLLSTLSRSCASRWLVFHILEALAEFERNLISHGRMPGSPQRGRAAGKRALGRRRTLIQAASRLPFPHPIALDTGPLCGQDPAPQIRVSRSAVISSESDATWMSGTEFARSD